jgi:hypothetical protein
MLARRKTEPPPKLSPYETACQRWRGFDAKRKELIERIDGMRLAYSFARSEDMTQVPAHLVEKAKPFMIEARRRPARLVENISELEDERAEQASVIQAERELHQAAQRAETNRIANELQPRHKAAVKAMAAAMEKLSQAIADEREVREELKKSAPLPNSAKLPDLFSDLLVGTLADWGSPMWKWAKKVRDLGALK